MGKLFGTDGIRGVVNDGLDAMLAFRVGMAAAQVMTCLLYTSDAADEL